MKKSTLKITLCILFFTGITLKLTAQESYIKIIDSFSPYSALDSKIAIGSGNKVSIAVTDYPGFSIVDFSKDGQVIDAFRISADSTDEAHLVHNFEQFENTKVISFKLNNLDQFTSGMCLINSTKDILWCRETSFHQSIFYTPLSFISSSGNIFTQIHVEGFLYSSDLTIAKLTPETGETEWCYAYKNDEKADLVTFWDMVEFQNKNIALNFSQRQESGKNIWGILKLSPDGSVLNNIAIENDSITLGLNGGVDKDGNLYQLGIRRMPQSTNNNFSDAFIAKFDSNLDFLWAKRLYAEKFSVQNFKIKALRYGGVLFTYNTSGDLPVISGKLDADGNLIWHTGYPFYRPLIEIGEDSSLFILSAKKYKTDGSSELAMVLAKTNPDNTFDGCPQFDACLTVHDMELPLTNLNWDRDMAAVPPMINFSIEPIDISTYDHCGTPRPPTPFFVLPDTICQNQSLQPNNLYNHLAHATEWTITSQNTNLQFADTSWNHQFTEPGTYQIEQEIWLLGCSEFFTRTLVVLPDSLGNLLGEDRLICDDNSLSLSPTAVRPLRTFEWSDGSNDSSITISNSGTYAVTASDGFCSASDEVELTFFKDKYPNEVFELPTDSMVCVDLLPLSLMPTSELTDSFYLANSTIPQTVFELKTEGNYQISTQIENCRVEKNFELKITPCEVDIFIPNTFSPNDDGINDFAEPFGKEFDGLSLEIFNRWGGKVFESTAAPFAWDGNFDGKKANEGVYVFVFKYRNLRNGLEEMVSGDVLLMR